MSDSDTEGGVCAGTGGEQDRDRTPVDESQSPDTFTFPPGADIPDPPTTPAALKSLPKAAYSPYSPLTTRSRKITSPTSSFPFSPVSAEDASLAVSPASTPRAGRRRTASSTSQDTAPGPALPPAPLLASMSRSSSTLSLCSNVSQVTGPLTPIEKLLKHLRERLCGCLFSGWYTERRYVEAIDRYRDVVLVDSVETPVIKQVKYAVRKCAKILEENSFVGLTLDGDECKLFVNFGGGGLEVTHPFGHYWLQIKSINFISSLGLCFDIGVVRQFVAADSQSCWRCKAREQQSEEAPVKMDSVTDVVADIKARLAAATQEVLVEVWQPGQLWANLRPHLTLANLLGLGKLGLVLLLAAVTGLVAAGRHAALFSLKLLHELAHLVERSTPLAMAALNMVTKCVGGAYLLIAMIWRDTVKRPAPGPAPPSRPALGPPRAAPPPVDQLLTSPRQRARPPGPSDHLSAMDHAYSQGRTW